MPFPRHQERYSKVSIILNAWHLAQLENLSRDIAEWYDVKVSRSEIVRTIIEMAMAKEDE
jgi:hypothetical protein